MSKSIFRKELAGFRPYVQGKPIEAVQREYGLNRIEKLASNENQFGPSPKAVQAIQDELNGINFYPEGHSHALVGALAASLNVQPENLVIGNGGEDLIRLISMTFLNEGEEIVIADPTFDVYSISASLMGGKTVKVPLADDRFDIPAMLEAVNENTKLVYLCTPNNPTGHIAVQQELDQLIQRLPEDVVLVLDEAYYEFASATAEYPKNNIALLETRPNTVILRTFSKIYGIAGVRVGYLITSPPIAEKINMIKQTFGVNRLAQAGAKAALTDTDYRDMVVAENRKALKFLYAYFGRKHWRHYPSYTNFVWVNTFLDSKRLFEELQKKGVIIRPGYLWGWDTWIRLSTGREDQMEFFVEMMEEVLAEWKG